MIESSELTAMRDAVLELMPSACHILSPTNTVDSQGAVMQTWGTVTANSKCRLDYRKGATSTAQASLQMYTGWVLTLPYNATVAEGYRVSYNSELYNITAIDKSKSWNIETVCEVEKL